MKNRKYAVAARPLFLASFAMMLTGCVAVWGGSYKIDSESSDAITIHYDSHFISAPEVEEVARNHCSQYNKAAAKVTDNTSRWGLTTTSFTCHT